MIQELERKYKSLLPAGFAAGAKRVGFDDSDGCMFFGGIYFLCIAGLFGTFAWDLLHYDDLRLEGLLCLVFTLALGLWAAYCISKSWTYLCCVVDREKVFFLQRNLLWTRARVFDRHDIDFADVVSVCFLREPTLCLFLTSGRSVPLVTALRHGARYAPFFDNVVENIGTAGGGRMSGTYFRAFFECQRRRGLRVGAGTMRRLSPGMNAFATMRARMQRDDGDEEAEVLHILQYRFGTKLPGLVLVFIAAVVIVTLLPATDADISQAFPPVAAFAVLLGVCFLNTYMTGSYCLSLEEDAVELCRVQLRKITRQRIHRADIMRVIHSRSAFSGGDRHKFEEHWLGARMRDNTVVRLLTVDHLTDGIAIWMGETTAWWLDVPFEKREG